MRKIKALASPYFARRQLFGSRQNFIDRMENYRQEIVALDDPTMLNEK